MKKVIIKISEEGGIEIVSKDSDVLLVLQYPDGAEIEVYENEKKIYKNR
jgi:hypothetical protein